MNTEQKGKFVISIDLEYGWGYSDRDISSRQREKIRGETEIIHRLLSLFDKYDIAATWAIVGRLLEEGDDPLWYDVDGVVEKIRATRVRHEIGSHSYAHLIYGDSTAEQIREDVEKAREIHTQRKLPFASFIFPRNSEKGHEILFENGLRVYRGAQKMWYGDLPRLLYRFVHLKSYAIPWAPTVSVSRHPSGLVNVPASMLLLSREGIRNLVLPFCVSAKAKAGLRRAVRKREVFHLWFHPSNFSYATETQFRILESVLGEAQRLQEKGVLEVLTMRDVASQYERD